MKVLHDFLTILNHFKYVRYTGGTNGNLDGIGIIIYTWYNIILIRLVIVTMSMIFHDSLTTKYCSMIFKKL